MAHYIGQPLKVVVHPKGFDGEALLPDDVAGLTWEMYRPITDSNLGVLVLEAPVEWNPTKSRWEVEVDTTGLTPGTYKCRSMLIGTEGSDLPTPEFTRIRLAAPPVVPIT